MLSLIWIHHISMKVYENGLNGNVDTFIDQVTKQATCTDNGSLTHTCKRCGYSYTSSINPLGHTFSNYVSNGNGTSTSKCGHCNETDTRVDVIIGDVNSDSVVNAKDRRDLTRMLAGWKDYPQSAFNLEACDVNQDSKVNAQDRMILTRYLAKWQEYNQLAHVK